MHIRKNRTPIQGLTNYKFHYLNQLKRSSLLDRASGKDFNTEPTQLSQKCSPAKLPQKAITISISEQSQQLEFQALSNIRNAFKSKPNIWRIAKAWNFPQKGYIEPEELKNRLRDNLNIQISEKEVGEIFCKFGGKTNKIDIENFVSMIYNEPGSFIFKHKLYNVDDQDRDRNAKIENLVDKVNVSLVKSKPNTAFVTRSKANRNSSVQSFFSKDEFCRIGISQARVNRFAKSIQFNPSILIGKNQSKTRFGSTPLRECLQLGNEKGTKSEDYPHEVDKQSKSMKIKLKLGKIQEYQKIQKQNISNTDHRLERRSEATLLRKKLDKEAYEYAVFLKNKWQ